MILFLGRAANRQMIESSGADIMMIRRVFTDASQMPFFPKLGGEVNELER